MNTLNIKTTYNQKGAIESIKWENHLCFNVGGGMFLITSQKYGPVSTSLKATKEELEELSSKDGVTGTLSSPL